jgi:hypothetical protein
MLPNNFPKWQLVYFYFSQWIKKGEKSEISLLEQALKKSGYRVPYHIGKKGKNDLFDNRLTEREKHRSS